MLYFKNRCKITAFFAHARYLKIGKSLPKVRIYKKKTCICQKKAVILYAECEK